MQRMMKTMRDAGMGGMQMYGRDDMDAMMNGEYDDDDDEDGGAAASTPRPSEVSEAPRTPRAEFDGETRGRGRGAEGGGRERVARRETSRSDAWSTITSAVSSRKAEDEYEL